MQSYQSISTQANGEPFSDLKGHWAKESVMRLIDLKIVNGFHDGTYRPNEDVTRVQFIKMLVQAKGYPLVIRIDHPSPNSK